MNVDSTEPVTLVRVPHEAEAAAIVAALKERGIEARTAGGLITEFRAEAPADVQVFVHRANLAQAQTALAEIRRENADIDWDQVDVGEPE